MIGKIIEFSVRNRFIVILLTAGVSLWGLWCLYRTPIDAIPDLSENQVIVWADWPGRSPKEIEDQITYPLSVNLQGLAGVKSVRATSEFGFSMINIIFDEDIEFYFARQRVLERLSIAGSFLPMGVVPYLAPDATALGQIFWYTVEGEGQSLDELRSVQDWYVRYQLNSVPGVAQVASVGGFVREYQIDIDPQKLRAYDISLGEVFRAVMASNSSVGGKVIHQGGAEYLVRGFGWIRSIEDLRNVVVEERQGVPITIDRLGSVQLGPGFRRSALEKNGREAVGGVVMMRYAENPLEVTRRVKEKIGQLQAGLPEGVRIVPFYDRTRLIHASIATLQQILIEAIVIASLVVLLVLMHLRSAFVICVSLPLAVLFSFILMYYLGVPSNIMSLSGIAISIGVLVDAGCVITENAYDRLQRHFGSKPVFGDTRELVIDACKVVGGPIFFSILITLLSFAPIFVLGGIEGKMFNPLAYTKSFALVGVAVLSITLLPAIMPLFIRGRLRTQQEVWLVRSLVDVYRPMLNFFLDHPDAIVLITGTVLLVGLPIFPQKVPWLFFTVGVPFVVAITALLVARRPLVCLGFLFCVSVASWRTLSPLGEEFMPPLDELSIMDMPVTTPNVNITQATDDIKERDAVLRRFPEVHQVVGKLGRADTPTDPAPIDMVETMVTLRAHEMWPKRKVAYESIRAEGARLRAEFEERGLLRPRAERAADLRDAVPVAREALEFLVHAPLPFPQWALDASEIMSDAAKTLEELATTGQVKLPRPDLATALARSEGVYAALRGPRPGRKSLERLAAYGYALDVLKQDPGRAIELVLAEEDEGLVDRAAMDAATRFDSGLRDTATRRLREHVPARGRELVRLLEREALAFLGTKDALLRTLKDAEWTAVEDELTGRYSSRFDEWILLEDVPAATQRVFDFLVSRRALPALADLVVEPSTLRSELLEPWMSARVDRRGPELARFARDGVLALLKKRGALAREVPAEFWAEADAASAREAAGLTLASLDPRRLTALARDTVDRLAAGGFLRPRADLAVDPPDPLGGLLDPLRSLTGQEKPNLFGRLRETLEKRAHELMVARVRQIDAELRGRAPGLCAWLLIEELGKHAKPSALSGREPKPDELQALRAAREPELAGLLRLERAAKADLVKEMDSELQVPGWGNIWTQPIINRVDMLATGVRTMIGVKVFGDSLETIQSVSDEIAGVLRQVRGAVDVFPDQIVGENYLEIDIDRPKAARYGVNVAEIQDVIEVALGGKEITMTVEGRQRFPVRVRYPRDWRDDEERVRNVLVPIRGGGAMGGPMGERMPADAVEGQARRDPWEGAGTSRHMQLPLSQLASVRIVPGPSMIKSENGLLRAYVQLNVRGRDIVGFVEEARRAVESKVQLPQGCYLEWSGQFEHQVRAQRTLLIVFPMVLLIIFVILYLTYRDLPDTLMMFLAVPGAIAGGALFQYIWGYDFSVAVWVGYVACFGLATETAIVMLVYLREAIEKRGGMEKIRSEREIREAVMEGAVHRLRPKLLTEATTILALIPMLWSTGVGSEFMRPMAAPILGGILVADEVIDILIPVLFYWDRCRRLRKRRGGDYAEGVWLEGEAGAAEVLDEAPPGRLRGHPSTAFVFRCAACGKESQGPAECCGKAREAALL